jgi:hypothetical protein
VARSVRTRCPVPHAWAYEGPWLWQFSGDGVNDHGIKVPGIHGQIDMNSFLKR